MKNFIKIISGGLISLVAALGCNKDVSLEPIFFQPTTYASEVQLDFQLAATYNYFTTEQLYAQGLWGYFTTGADEVFRTDAATGTSTQVLTESYRGTSGEVTYSTFWRNCYKGVEQCNVILDGVSRLTIGQPKKNSIVGQTLFLRAYYFYLLTSNFGDIVLKTTLTTDLGTNFALPKTPTKQVYDFILADMKRADTLVQNISTIGNTTVVSQSAVEAVLARVCLSMAGNPVNDASKYAEASFWANKVIASGTHALNAAPLAVYATYPTTAGVPAAPAYSNIFTNNMQNVVSFGPGNTEGIWDAAFLSKSNVSGAYANTGFLVNQQLGSLMGITNPTSVNGYSGGAYRVFPKLYNLYANGDLRRDWIASPYIFDANNNKYGYITAAVIPAVSTPVYSGKPAVLSVFINASGGISSINVVDGGTGYTKLPTISITVPATGSGGSYKIDTLGGAIKAITILSPGSGYVIAANRCVGKWRREYETNLSGVVRINNNTSCNFPIIRYAEVLLIAAEADLKKNGTPSAQAVDYYNQVRRRAYGATNVTSPLPGVDVTTFTFQDIMDERSRELCFEGQRRLDLIRWGNMATVMQNLVLDNNINIAATTLVTAANITASNFLSNPAKYSLFPIPAYEIINDNALTQNPGW